MKNLTEIIFLVDRSGSMSSIKKDMEGGFQTFLKEQKKSNVGEVNVSLYQFDDKFDEVFVSKSIKETPALEITPRGMTALYDAINKTIVNTRERFSKLKKKDRPSKVVLCIITDGQENASREIDSNALKTLIGDVDKKDKWNIIYLGANQDALLTAKTIGVNLSTSATYDASAQGSTALWGTLASGISCARAAVVSGGTWQPYEFSASDRRSLLAK